MPDSPTAERHVAGDVEFLTAGADVRRVTVRGREVVRRIFVTVRDADWREVPPIEWSSTFDARRRVLSIAARYDPASIDLSWSGEFTLGDDGSMRFEVAGLLRVDARVNRLGVAILHPADALVGGEIESSGPAGTARATVTSAPMPQPIADGHEIGITPPFSRLVTRFRDGTRIAVDLGGDLGEIEDQRNFGDDSFKTYQPPLGADLPYTVSAGRFAHAITIEAEDVAAVVADRRWFRGPLPAIVADDLDLDAGPALGLASPVVTHDGYLAELNRGTPMSIPGHLEFTVDPTVHSGDWLTIAENVPALSSMLEFASTLTSGEVWPAVQIANASPAVAARVAPAVGLGYLAIAAEWGTLAVRIRSSLVPPGTRAVWHRLLDLLAEVGPEPEVEIDELTRRILIAWGQSALDVNLGAAPVALPSDAELVWPAEAPERTLPPFGIALLADRGQA